MNKTWETFSKNYEKLLLEEYGHDLIVNVGEEPLVKSFKAHKVILGAQSPYFRRALSNEWAKQEDGKIVFNKPNVSPPIFDVILKYIYTGKIEAPSRNLNVDDVDVDSTEWSKETMQNFQQILADCIPLIRFTLMSPEEFREKVWPFKDCLPTKLYDTILWHFIMPEKQSSPFLPRLKTIDSKLITLKHAALIATWIDRKEGKTYSHTEIPYEFSLLMRGSRDGFSQQTLHNRCGGQAKTIMLMKIKSTEEIFGMYISSVWSNNTARQHDSFMFSFGEGRETRTPVLSRVRAAGYDLALQRGQERGMDELEMFKITSKTPFSGF
ncbi:unnamed protein product [Rhizophagus irregularis]|nr:unnamed protein product [Rhizophagus irregularis]